MPELLSFDDVLTRASAEQLSLLAGNGFSIACTRSFDYERLFDEADFGGRRGAKRVRTLFTRAETADFETVVRRLEESAATAALYPNADRIVRRMNP